MRCGDAPAASDEAPAAAHPAQPWPAPSAAGPVRATVGVPGSKSVTNRALVLAAQATGVSTLVDPLDSRDTSLMADALAALGVRVDREPGPPPGTGAVWRIHPAPLTGNVAVDCGLAGTVMRFLPPLATLAAGDVAFDGDLAARRRPMATTAAALRDLGARISGDRLPMVVHGTGSLAGGTVTLDAGASSQFVSGLLLAAPSWDRGVTVHHDGKQIPSLPHIAMTVQLLRAHGVEVDDSTPDTWRVAPGPVRPWTSAIEPDLSNATVFLAAAAATGGRVTVPHWPTVTTQPGDHFGEIVSRMGATVLRDGDGLTVVGPDRLQGVDVDLHDASELTPTVAALAALADTPSHLRGIGHIRGHETDRLAALEHDIRALGGTASSDDDALHITPARLHGGGWAAYADHRIATAGAIIGLRVPGVLVDDIACTAKTFPTFPALWSQMLGGWSD